MYIIELQSHFQLRKAMVELCGKELQRFHNRCISHDIPIASKAQLMHFALNH